MPTYEYQCTRCGELTSEFKPITAPRRQRCPHCRGKVQQIITGGLGVHFKGDGFYVNDSRKAARARADKAATGDGGGHGGAASGTAGETPAPSGNATAGAVKSGDAKSGDAKSGDAKPGTAKSGSGDATAPSSGKTSGKPTGRDT